MKRLLMVALPILVVLSVTAAVPAAHAGSEKEAPYEEGLWVGTARITGAAEPHWDCSTWDFPLIFYVRDGVAKSSIELDWLSFETKMRSKGRIKINMREMGTVDHGGGWVQKEPVIISGKLKGRSGKGSVRMGGCVGRWKVEKSSDQISKGVEFAAYKDRILLLVDGEMVRALQPFEGKELADVKVANDFFIVHIGEDPESGTTAFYSFENPGELRQISSIPGHYYLEGDATNLKERGCLPSLSEGKLVLQSKGEEVDSVGPGKGSSITGFCDCGDFIAVHEEDGGGRKTTIVYYVNKKNLLSTVGIVRGGHYRF